MFSRITTGVLAVGMTLSAGIYADADERNRNQHAPITLKPADLLISNLVIVQPTGNYCKVYVKNAGVMDAKNFVVRIRFYNGGGMLERTVPLCKGGDTQVVHFHWTQDFNMKYFVATADATDVVKESDEKDNHWVHPWFPKAPPAK